MQHEKKTKKQLRQKQALQQLEKSKNKIQPCICNLQEAFKSKII